MIELKYIIPIVIAILVLIGGHFLVSKRESDKRKKEMRVGYLVEAFRKLEKGASPPANDYSAGDFESAISDIQLFGSSSQVKLAHNFCEAASKGDGSLLQDLLENIRTELRKELALPDEVLPKINPFRVSATANKALHRTSR
jgi:hypothetical protein